MASDLAFSVGVRNAMLDAIEVTGGSVCAMEILNGTIPDTCATAETDTVLVTIALPSDWMAAANAGAKAKAGTWQDATADATGTASYFRIYSSQTTKDNTTCIMQGTAGETADTPDLVLDNKAINSGQQVTITGFTLTAGNSGA